MAELVELMTTVPTRAAAVHFNFRAGSTIPVPVCAVPMDFMLHIG